MKHLRIFGILLLALAIGDVNAQEAAPVEGTFLYRVQLVRATPGEFRPFMQDAKDHFDQIEQAGDERPVWMRHSQGDQWDFMILHPMGEWSEFHSVPRTVQRAALADSEKAFADKIAWTEDLFVRGVPPSVLRPAMDSSGFFHVEMFKALPGKAAELLEQRRMENSFLTALNRPVNFIFYRDAGGAVDSFTLGCYRDLGHFAESANILPEAEEAAARLAGFGGVSDISPYLRSLIAEHHDTLAVAIQ